MSLTAFSIDITLPLFGVMADDLNAPISRIPLTITFYMVSMGIGQLLFGALSDRFGRRGVLVLGMCLFIFGAVLASFANSVGLLIGARAIQGFGAAAPYILSRAILRDLYSGTALAQKMAIATGIFSVGPMLAPLLGALVLEIGGNWRWIFVMMTIYCTGLLMTVKFVAETNKHKDPNATKANTLISNSIRVLSNQQSRLFLTINAIIMTSMLLIISTSASVYANTFNITGSAFAVYYAVHAIGIVIGQIANHRLIGAIGVIPTSIIASIIMLVGAMSISLCAITDNLAPWGVSLSIAVFALGFLSVMSNATSMILEPHSNIVGFTAALQGTLTTLISGLLASALSVFVQNSIALWGLVIACGPILAMVLLIKWLLLKSTTTPDTSTVG